MVWTARVALSDPIHDGFFLTLVCTLVAVGVSLAMKNVRLEAPAGPVEEGDATEAPPIPGLARTLHQDAAGDPEDERLAALLTPGGADGNGGRAEALLGLAERIESRDGGYPNLLHAAAALANGRGGERERAVHASKTVIPPLAAAGEAR